MDNVSYKGMDSVSIHQPNYLPWLGFFHKMNQVDKFILLDDVQFSKNSVQNRNIIRSRDGKIMLAVPVLTTGKFGQVTNEVLIDKRSRWQDKHLKTIQMNYSKAPYYNVYKDELEYVYQQQYEKLTDVCVNLISVLVKWLGISTEIVMASILNVNEDSTEKLISLTKKVGCNLYLSGPSGRKYMEQTRFKQEEIILKFHSFVHPIYTQFSSKDFIANLSALDLIFNYGEDSKKVLFGEHHN